MAGLYHEVTARFWGGVLLERYCFSPDLEVSLPKHTHEEYQIGLALTHPGEYFYRRAYYAVPIGSISVIHPGEVHSGCGLRKRKKPTEFLSFYIPPQNLMEQLGAGRETAQTEFPFVAPILLDPGLESILRRLHRAFRSQAVTLKDEVLWNWALHRMFKSGPVRANPQPNSAAGVQRVREYLDEHAEQRLTLRQLAQLAGLTEWHLSRAFHQAFGIPLHRYQTQRRVDLAKRLLLRGVAPSEVALRAGFSHQSHLGRYFREFLNVGPGAYQSTAKT